MTMKHANLIFLLFFHLNTQYKQGRITTHLKILRGKYCISKNKVAIEEVIKERIFCKKQKTKNLEVHFLPYSQGNLRQSAIIQVSGVYLKIALQIKSKENIQIDVFSCIVLRVIHHDSVLYHIILLNKLCEDCYQREFGYLSHFLITKRVLIVEIKHSAI